MNKLNIIFTEAARQAFMDKIAEAVINGKFETRAKRKVAQLGKRFGSGFSKELAKLVK
ncbi:MAG: hypothetical protein ACP5JE_05145 [Thermoplasmata archaeon]